MTVVVDASVLAAALVDSGPEGRWAESLVGRAALSAPERVIADVTDVLGRLERRGIITHIEANGARRDLFRLTIELAPLSPFADRAWELRHTLPGDRAWYVAVAEAFECPLATLDQGLSLAAGPTCRFMGPFMETTRSQRSSNATDALDEVVKRVVAVAQPEMIILFGSAARGEVGPDSDLDLLVVKSDADAPDLMREIYMGLIGVGTAVDAIVISPEDLERYKDSRGLVIREALGEGKVVYQAA